MTPGGARYALLVLAALALALTPLVPPLLPDGGDGEGFSARRAMAHVERIADEPRPIGSDANEAARHYVSKVLEDLGLEPEFQTIAVPDYFEGGNGTVQVTNLLVTIPGTSPKGSVALIGHIDTVPESPGAADDASAVAIILEVARVLSNRPAPVNTLVLLVTDGEEPAPRYGARAFLDGHPAAHDIAFAVNLEALGSGGPSMLLAAGGAGRSMLGHVRAMRFPVAYSYVTALHDLIGGSSTDLGPFRERGIPGVELAWLHGSPVYHTDRDRADGLSLRSLYQQGTDALALVEHLTAEPLDASPGSSKDAFLTVGPWWVLRLPAWIVYGLLVAIAAAAIVAARRLGPRLLARCSGATLLTVGATALVATALWLLVARVRTRPGIGESYLYLCALVLAAWGVSAAMARRTRHGSEQAAVLGGVIAVWWIFALTTTVLAPGIGYVFVLPAAAAALPLVAASDRMARVTRAVVPVVTIVVLVPAIDTFYQLAQPRPGNPDSEMHFMVVVPALLLGLGFELVRAVRRRAAMNGVGRAPAIRSNGDTADRPSRPPALAT